MKRAWGCVAAVALAGTLPACRSMNQGAADGGVAGNSDASVVIEAGPAEAFNESEMVRYPDEKSVDHAPLTAESGGNMRTQAGSGGDLVMILKRGTEVAKVAEHEGYYLVIADDVKDPTRKLMGWIGESAFSAGEAPHRPAALVDAGGAKPIADAGTKPGPLRPLDIHKSPNGSCAAGYAPCSALCRATCKVASDCGPIPLVTCTGGFCLGPGAQPCK